VKAQIFAQNLSPLAQSISGKGFQEGGKSVTQRRVQEVTSSSSRFNQTQAISLKTSLYKQTTNKSKNRVVKLTSQNTVAENSTKVLIDLDENSISSQIPPNVKP
jgi:hypothetical protein